MPRRYWVVRTDQKYKDFFMSEIRHGRLRQGWGYDNNLDIRVISKIIESDGWNSLTPEQKEAWPNWRLCEEFEGSIQNDDIVVVPNLPNAGMFCILKVVGEYTFKIPENWTDYGNIRMVELLTPDGIDKQNAFVSANIRTTLRTPARMWNVDGYAHDIDNLLQKTDDGVKLDKPTSRQELLNRRVSDVTDDMHRILWNSVMPVLEAAEWEEPVRDALQKLYPGATVTHVGGPNENGADVIIRWPNPFSEHSRPWAMPVQIKNYVQTHDETGAVDRIEQAYYALRDTNVVVAGVILSTADSFSAQFTEYRKAKEGEMGIPICAANKEALMDLLMSNHFGIRFPI